MSEVLGAQLDEAHDALRAWCHDRPDLRDPSIAYRAFGSVTAIIATLEHIVDVASASVARATGADDYRSVSQACLEIRQQAVAAGRSLEEAYRAVAAAHEITSHLIFGHPDDEPSSRSARRTGA